MHARWIPGIASAVLVAAALVGCGGSSPSQAGSNAVVTAPGVPNGPGTGTLRISLKDSPFSDASALLVTFSEVSAHASGDTWTTVPFAGAAASRTCDLKKLVAAEDVLGVVDLPAGHYTQIRLTVAGAAIYFGGASSGVCGPDVTAAAFTSKADVTIPSGEIKLNREFDVPAGGVTTILLDFDGDKSIKETGNGQYKMTPVIGIVSVK